MTAVQRAAEGPKHVRARVPAPPQPMEALNAWEYFLSPGPATDTYAWLQVRPIIATHDGARHIRLDRTLTCHGLDSVFIGISAKREHVRPSSVIARNILSPVNGGWSAWGEFSACSTTCGGGRRTRMRTCSSPAPANGGNTCDGSSSESQPCNTNGCPIPGKQHSGRGSRRAHGKVSLPWSLHGISTIHTIKYRTISITQQKHTTPMGTGFQAITVFFSVNGGWSSWGAWRACTQTCGGGTQTRMRTCASPVPANGGAPCAGTSSQSRLCNSNACLIAGKLSILFLFLRSYSVRPSTLISEHFTRATPIPYQT